MAKNDNLKDFLTDVADAIREKKGTTDLINPQDFSAEIASIETGGGGESGGGVSVPEKDVNFRDYDGTILHSYTKAQFLALSELPQLPTQKGLICQEWNWSLEDAKSYVAEYGMLEVGATYITDDGKTRLYIRIGQSNQRTVLVRYKQSIANGVEVDWGDGTEPETAASTSYLSLSHDYSDSGDYIITLNVIDGSVTLGNNSTSYGVMGSNSDTNIYLLCRLMRVEIGRGVGFIDKGTFVNCYNLQSITLPNHIQSIGSSAFALCESLSYVCVPNGATNLGEYSFQECSCLSGISLSNSLTTACNSRTFVDCYALKAVTIPSKATSISQYCCSNCRSLQKVVIPNSINSIGSRAFEGCASLYALHLPEITSIPGNMAIRCLSLESIVIPKSVTSIGNYAFQNAKILAVIDCRSLTIIPTLSGSAAFGGLQTFKIIVPDELYDSWIEASNWSTYASNIVKASEYTD